MIKIEFNSPLNYGETVYFLMCDKIDKGTLVGVTLRDYEGNVEPSYIVKRTNRTLPDFADEVYTSQEELFKAIMLKEDTDEKEGEAIGK